MLHIYIPTYLRIHVKQITRQIHNQGYIQTIMQPCLQDHVKQITGQGYIHVT